LAKGRPDKLASADDSRSTTATSNSRSEQNAAQWPTIKPLRDERERLLLRTAREELIRLGCLVGPPDGAMDLPTEIALRRFSESSTRFVKTDQINSDQINEELARAMIDYADQLCPASDTVDPLR
jgi:hypothetical protein